MTHIAHAWRTRFIGTPDTTRFVLRGRLKHDNNLIAEFEIYKAVRTTDDGTAIFKSDCVKEGNETTRIEEASIIFSADVKWDECGHFSLGYVHVCSKMEAAVFGAVFPAVYEMAWEILPRAEWEQGAKT